MEDSPLRKLSPELRNIIYELVLLHDKPITIVAKQVQGQPATAVSCKTRNGRIHTSLLQVCKAIRQETSELFFAINTFHFESSGWSPAHLFHNFTIRIGRKQAVALRVVVIYELLNVNDLVNTILIARKAVSAYPSCRIEVKGRFFMRCGAGKEVTIDVKDLERSFARGKDMLRSLRSDPVVRVREPFLEWVRVRVMHRLYFSECAVSTEGVEEDG